MVEEELTRPDQEKTLGELLVQATKEAVAFERGELEDVRITKHQGRPPSRTSLLS